MIPSSKQNPASRTQKKKKAQALQRLGEALLALNDGQLSRIDMPEELYRAIRTAHLTTRHGARRRQLQYIGALMRKVETAGIETALKRIARGEDPAARRRVRLCRQVDMLLAGDNELMQQILDDFPNMDRQRLGHLIRQARKDALKAAETTPAPASHARLLNYLDGHIPTDMD